MLSTRSRYALHALVYLAGQKTDDPVRTSEIADANGLPRKFLEGILSDLKKGGILESKRGQQGGYRLARSPRQIRLSEIVKLLEGPILLTPCSHNAICDECTSRGFCHLRLAFQDVNQATESRLDRIRLDGLVLSKTRIKQRRNSKVTGNRRKYG